MSKQSSPSPPRLRYLGWTVGVTYQSESPGGVDRDHLMRLLDEMTEHRMNLLSLFVIGQGNFDPRHDGYCWPVQNPKLRNYWDATAINASERTEFLREVIRAAGERGIEVQLFMNWGLWNPDRVVTSYPAATRQKDREGKHPEVCWRHCPDCPDVWQKGLDEVEDLLSFYDDEAVTSYGFETLDYAFPSLCFCEYTQEKYRQETGADIFQADETALLAWQSASIYRHIKSYIEHIRSQRPNIQVWLHTQGLPRSGRNPDNVRKWDLDYLLPHTIQFPTTRQELYAMLERVAPVPCVLHFCVRDEAPKNYPIWKKTPEDIVAVLGWVDEYQGGNLAGLLFFNETIVSDQNRRAVYQELGRFT